MERRESRLSLGVDGCRGGWFAVTLSENAAARWEMHSSFDALMETCGEEALILIDIPIGLPGSEPRRCDYLARRLLGGRRGSSVFPVPCRQAVYAASFEEANSLNCRVLGRGVPIQAWNICKRMQEVDEHLRKRVCGRAQVRESHPELCFLSLGGEAVVSRSKKTAGGIHDRLELLQQQYERADMVYRSALRDFRRRDLGSDDILDALVLALTAHLFRHRLVSVPPEGQIDEHGLPMEIVYPDTTS